MDIFKDFNVTRYEGQLKNGIKIVLFHRHGAPITTRAILKSGSRYDPSFAPGIAHFIEHMIVNGSPEFPSKDLLAECIESVGGFFEAATGQEYMIVYTEISEKEDFTRAIDVFNATLCRPLMDKKVFENEKNVVIKEIKKGNSEPVKILQKTSQKLFFKDTVFEHLGLGDEESISNLNYADVVAHHKKLFDRSRITFVASGDISLEELTSKLDTISFLEGNEFNQVEESHQTTNQKNILSELFDAPQTYIYFGVYSPRSYTKESIHLNLLGQILAGGRASRLTKRLRYKKGLIYGIGFSRNGGIDFGSWGISTNTSEDKVQEVVNEIIEEINNIQKNGVKEAELEFVKNKRIKSLKRTMQTSNDWVDFHAVAEVFVNETYNINTFVTDTENTTIEDIKYVINKYLGSAKWKLAMCGRTKEESILINFDE